MEYRYKKKINTNWKSKLVERTNNLSNSQDAYKELYSRQSIQGLYEEDINLDEVFLDIDYNKWKDIEIPHNWEDYHGYHQVSHGNLHDSAWYSKIINIVKEKNKHYFLYFEGVGAYGDVWINDHYIGGHKGGRTSFTLDITEAIIGDGSDESLIVKAAHPEKIMDLPWVCGGCFGTPNTEGSQPLGIFRPVSLYETGPIRVKPFGVWVKTESIGTSEANITISTQVENLSSKKQEFRIVTEILDQNRKIIERLEDVLNIDVKKTITHENIFQIKNPKLWELKNPNLYTVRTMLLREEKVSDSLENSFGIRHIEFENLENGQNTQISQERLQERPSEDNDYFVTYTRSDDQAPVGIVPGGVKIYIENEDNNGKRLFFDIEVLNRTQEVHTISVESFVQDYHETKSIYNMHTQMTLAGNEGKVIRQQTDTLFFLDEWTIDHPQLHSVITTIRDLNENLKEYNQTKTTFGVFQTEKLANKGYPYVSSEVDSDVNRRFLLNGEPVFINGTCEYEHLLGNDHAFYSEQITARMDQIKAAGFNSLREAHCPHNLEYLEYCDREGLLFWAQMGAHLYFDNDDFKENFKILTKEWVLERRNSPSVILWGIQNESMLPAEFTDELRQLIRSLDGSSPKERKVVTCNGGYGSDWNVPQNWSGTYGRSVEDYASEIIEQALVGEYGQYRVLGKHEEGNMESKQNAGGDVSEELFTYCLGTKVREAEKIKDSIYGHYQWIFTSHANPGRETLFCLDGSGLDGIGVVNSKGLITSWGEPVDAYYMYRSYYAPKESEPMVYIVSHTWEDRFLDGPRNADIMVYSNCDKVELMNDYKSMSLGVIEQSGKGIPFVFKDVFIENNVLYARAFNDDKLVGEDVILLNGLKESVHYDQLFENAISHIQKDDTYIYRVNCGGKAYIDQYGQLWSEDIKYNEKGLGYRTWGMDYDDVDDELGCIRHISSPVRNAIDQELFQTFRYGRDKLEYHFPVEKGLYIINLYFIEPWYGVGGGIDAESWRVFDIAVNGQVVLKDLDIWKEAGCQSVLHKSIKVAIETKDLCIHFPKVKSHQGIICAISIAKA